MNIQNSFIEASSDLRARAAALTTVAFDMVRARAGIATQRVDLLRNSVVTLTFAGRALNKAVQRHAARFVKENSAIAVAAGKDFGAIASSTYATLSGRKIAANIVRKRRATRKRAASKAA